MNKPLAFLFAILAVSILLVGCVNQQTRNSQATATPEMADEYQESDELPPELPQATPLQAATSPPAVDAIPTATPVPTPVKPVVDALPTAAPVPPAEERVTLQEIRELEKKRLELTEYFVNHTSSSYYNSMPIDGGIHLGSSYSAARRNNYLSIKVISAGAAPFSGAPIQYTGEQWRGYGPEINYCGYAHFNNLTQQWNCSSQLVSQDFDALISNRVSQGGSTTAVSYSDAYDLLKNNARNPTDAICDSSSQNGLVPPPNPPESSTAEINYQKLADSLIYIFSIRDAVLGPRLLTDEIILKTGLRTTDLTIIGEKVKVRFLGERKIANRECKAFEINLPASEQPRTRTIGCSSITEEPLNATWKVCLDKEYGVALEYSFTEGNRRGSSRSITEFRTATNAADFTLPSNHQVITDDDYWNYFFQP